MNGPLVSVGIPTYNRSTIVGDAIEHILKQSYDNLELIIYNDGSTDETTSVVKSFKDRRIQFIDCYRNKGQPYPLNKLLSLANGKYFIYLGDHDIFHRDLLKKCVTALEENTAAAFVMPGLGWVAPDGQANYREIELPLKYFNVGYQFGSDYLLEDSKISYMFHASCMFRIDSLEKIGKYYDPRYGIFSDVDLSLRLLAKFNFCYLKEILVTARTREKGHFLEYRDWEMANWIFDIQRRNIDLFFSEDGDKHKFALKVLKKKKVKHYAKLIPLILYKQVRRIIPPLNSNGFRKIS